MYLCIDIGGTKTIVAVYDESGQVKFKTKLETSQNYKDFLVALGHTISNTKYDIKRCVVGIPGLLNRDEGTVYALGNLPWKNKPIKEDISKLIDGKEVVIENDSRLAGLAEARARASSDRERILYLTISTGIGGALVVNGKLVEELEDTEMGQMPVEHEGKIGPWEDFASGRAIVSSYGRKASQISDPAIWADIGLKIGYGVGALCSVLQPEVIIFGGGVGQFTNKFAPALKRYLKANLQSVVHQPKEIVGPRFAEDSVIQGCYELASQHK